MESSCSPQQVRPLPSLQVCSSQGHCLPSAAARDTAPAAECMWWFRKHYVFIFKCCCKTESRYSHFRGEEHWTEDLNQTLIQAARSLASTQQDCACSAPSQTCHAAWKAGRDTGSNIHLVPALVLPAPSRVTVRKAPGALVPSRGCGGASAASQSLPCSCGSLLFPKAGLGACVCHCRGTVALPWLCA